MIKSINSITELAEGMGCPEHYIGKALFKGTNCGICFEETDTGIVIAGYAEGSDGECPSHEMTYPFEIDDFWKLVRLLDEEGCELWHEANIDECDACINHMPCGHTCDPNEEEN